MYNLKNDQSIVIKEVEKRLSCMQTYEKVSSCSSFLIKTIYDTLEKIQSRGDKIFLVMFQIILIQKILSLVDLLPKIHKKVYDIPRTPVISNCGFYTENVSAFLDHQFLLLWKLSHISDILMIFLKNSDTSQIYQKIL